MSRLRLVIGISGASGTVYAIRLLQVLRGFDSIETYVTMTKVAEDILIRETGLTRAAVEVLAGNYYDSDEMAAPIASGSFKTDGMVIIPCSMKTLSGIALGFSDNLLLRSADVTLKEGRRLIVVPRETPLNPIHIENMLKLARLGVTVLPAMPAFYHRPTTVEGLVDFVVGKVLDQLGIEHSLYTRWGT